MLKPKVILGSAFHREMEVVKICFERNEAIMTCLRCLKNLRWSKTLSAWYVPKKACIEDEIFKLVGNVAVIEGSGQKTLTQLHKNEIASVSNVVVKRRESTTEQLAVLSEEKEAEIEEFKNWMSSRRYSKNTIGTYVDALKIFLRFYANKEIATIDNKDLIVFNNVYILKNKLSPSFQNQVVNAIKLFFRTVEMKSMVIESVHRPKRQKSLPNVLSKEEIKLILTAHGNLKHRAMLSLIYSCGLRRGELLNLRLNDIDSKRGLVIIRQAKGRKDRIAPLSEKMLVLLRDYYAVYKPKFWLFEGQEKNSQYDESSLASVLKQALEKSKLDKPVTLHWLRHSYATHLLESGTDLRYIQEILGHSRSTTTEIYTHVSNKNIQRIISPFDSL